MKSHHELTLETLKEYNLVKEDLNDIDWSEADVKIGEIKKLLDAGKEELEFLNETFIENSDILDLKSKNKQETIVKRILQLSQDIKLLEDALK